MLRLLLGTCFIIFNYLSNTHGSIWPRPRNLVVKDTFYSIDPNNFSFTLSEKAAKCAILSDAVQRYQKLTFSSNCSLLKSKSPSAKNKDELDSLRDDPNYKGEVNRLVIATAGPCPNYPLSNMSEIYTLRVMYGARQEAFLYAEEVWGVLRGLESFSQMVYPVGSTFVINSTFLVDFPRFPVRGLLLDTSRHFIPVSQLLLSLDAMAYNKMNVFHWHIVDDQSFPYVSERYPQISEYGAFNSDHVYSQKDVQNVIEYAGKRGIRVLVEFDTPGHTLSWGKTIESLLTKCYTRSLADGTYGPIDPTKNQTYEFLRDFFSEIVSVFPDDYIHLGGDEVDFTCWKSNPEIAKFMKVHHISGEYEKLESLYMQKLVEIIKDLKREYIVWQEVFDNGVRLEENAVVHIWKHYERFDYQQELFNVTQSGYRALLSAPWYLNYISYGSDWRKFYLVEPLKFNGSVDQQALVMGGIAAMWGEYVDGTNMLTRTWPRASAVAERLWSDKTVVDIKDAARRIDEMRCRLLARGIRAEPVVGPGYCKCDAFM